MASMLFHILSSICEYTYGFQSFSFPSNTISCMDTKCIVEHIVKFAKSYHDEALCKFNWHWKYEYCKKNDSPSPKLPV